MSRKASQQRRAAAKTHRSDAAFWKSHSEKQSNARNRQFFRDKAAEHLRAARMIERG